MVAAQQEGVVVEEVALVHKEAREVHPAGLVCAEAMVLLARCLMGVHHAAVQSLGEPLQHGLLRHLVQAAVGAAQVVTDGREGVL